MPAAQPLLLPDPRPLVERLGREFFRTLPESAGVYLMSDSAGTILYIGKAKNLRQRLCSYRVANPDRMPKRHLRLLRTVVRIELLPCIDERAALAKEAELLRAVRPRFNRAGTWRPPPRYLAWRCLEDRLHLSVRLDPMEDWHCHGPYGSMAAVLQQLLARTLWLAVHLGSCVETLPCGWFHGHVGAETIIDCGPMAGEVASHLNRLFAGEGASFLAWLNGRLSAPMTPFAKVCLEADLEVFAEIFPSAKAPAAPTAPSAENERLGRSG